MKTFFAGAALCVALGCAALTTAETAISDPVVLNRFEASGSPSTGYTIKVPGMRGGTTPDAAHFDPGYTPALAGDMACPAGNPAACVLQTVGGSIANRSTSSYWADDATAANFVRLNDRVIIGRAANAYTGSFSDLGETWLSTFGAGQLGYLERSAQLLDYSSIGEMAAVFAVRTSDNRGVRGQNGCCGQALSLVTINDDSTTNSDSTTGEDIWSLYQTSVSLPGSGRTHNESDWLTAKSAAVIANPYNSNPLGATVGQVYNAGGELAYGRATVTASLTPGSGNTGILNVTAIGSTHTLKYAVTPNAYVYGVGITDDGKSASQVQIAAFGGSATGSGNNVGTYNVTCTSTCPTIAAGTSLQLGYVKYTSANTAAVVFNGNGTTWDVPVIVGTGVISNPDPAFMELPQGISAAKWVCDTTGVSCGYIKSTANASSNASGIELSPNGLLYKNSAGNILAQFPITANAANYLQFNAAAAGSDASIQSSSGGLDIFANNGNSNVNVLGPALHVTGQTITDGVTTSSGGANLGGSSLSGVAAKLQNSAAACTHTPTTASETVTCSSDARLKKRIRDATNALRWLDSFRIREFETASDGSHHTGVVAQELRTDHPEMVHTFKGDHGKPDLLAAEQPDPWRVLKSLQDVYWLVKILFVWNILLTIAVIALGIVLRAGKRAV